MKHLKSYNESAGLRSKFEELKNTIEDLKDICIDLEDNEFMVTINPDDDIKIKLLSITVDDNRFQRDIPFYIEIVKYNNGVWAYNPTTSNTARKVFRVSDIKETILQVKEYMDSKGFDSKIQITHPQHSNRGFSKGWEHVISPLEDSVTFFVRISFTHWIICW